MFYTTHARKDIKLYYGLTHTTNTRIINYICSIYSAANYY